MAMALFKQIYELKGIFYKLIEKATSSSETSLTKSLKSRCNGLINKLHSPGKAESGIRAEGTFKQKESLDFIQAVPKFLVVSVGGRLFQSEGMFSTSNWGILSGISKVAKIQVAFATAGPFMLYNSKKGSVMMLEA
jgi:hypothetical protein